MPSKTEDHLVTVPNEFLLQKKLTSNHGPLLHIS